jgi:hypothetical protein
MNTVEAERRDQVGAVLDQHGDAALLRRQAQPLDDRPERREVEPDLPAQQQAGDIGGGKRSGQRGGKPLGRGGVGEPRRRQIESAVQGG